MLFFYKIHCVLSCRKRTLFSIVITTRHSVFRLRELPILCVCVYDCENCYWARYTSDSLFGKSLFIFFKSRKSGTRSYTVLVWFIFADNSVLWAHKRLYSYGNLSLQINALNMNVLTCDLDIGQLSRIQRLNSVVELIDCFFFQL